LEERRDFPWDITAEMLVAIGTIIIAVTTTIMGVIMDTAQHSH